MNSLIACLTLKDCLIIVALAILLFLIFETRRLKKIIAQETLARLMPEVGLLIKGDINKSFYLKNYSTSIARNISIEDTEIDVDDSGFKITLKVIFDALDSLPQLEERELNYKIFHQDKEADEETKSRYMNHIKITDFDCFIRYKNIQNTTFRSHIVNRQGKLSIREISRIK